VEQVVTLLRVMLMSSSNGSVGCAGLVDPWYWNASTVSLKALFNLDGFSSLPAIFHSKFQSLLLSCPPLVSSIIFVPSQ